MQKFLFIAITILALYHPQFATASEYSALKGQSLSGVIGEWAHTEGYSLRFNAVEGGRNIDWIIAEPITTQHATFQQAIHSLLGAYREQNVIFHWQFYTQNHVLVVEYQP